MAHFILASGEAIVFGSAFHVPTRVQFDRPKPGPYSQTAAPFHEWSRETSCKVSIMDSKVPKDLIDTGPYTRYGILKSKMILHNFLHFNNLMMYFPILKENYDIKYFYA